MILVVGCGFVGETVAKSLEQNDQPVIRIDPKYNDNTIDMYVGTPGLGAIVCVPTPTVDGFVMIVRYEKYLKNWVMYLFFSSVLCHQIC